MSTVETFGSLIKTLRAEVRELKQEIKTLKNGHNFLFKEWYMAMSRLLYKNGLEDTSLTFLKNGKHKKDVIEQLNDPETFNLKDNPHYCANNLQHKD